MLYVKDAYCRRSSRNRCYLNNLPILPKRCFVGLGAAKPPAFCSMWYFGAMTVSRRRSCGGRGAEEVISRVEHVRPCEEGGVVISADAMRPSTSSVRGSISNLHVQVFICILSPLLEGRAGPARACASRVRREWCSLRSAAYGYHAVCIAVGYPDAIVALDHCVYCEVCAAFDVVGSTR